MKIFKNKLIPVLMVTTVLGTTLVGCTSSNEGPEASVPTSNEQATDSDNKVAEEEKILVWTNNRHDAEYMQQVVDNFNKEHDGEIEIEFVINTDNYINMITMGISSDQAPDVFCVGAATTGFDLKSFVDANIIQPLNPFMTEEFKGLYDIAKLNYQNINALEDNLFYVPTAQRSGMRIIYNKEMFEASNVEIPTTLQEVVDVSKQLTEAGGGTKYGIGMPGQSAPFIRLINPSAEVSGVLPYDYVNGRFDFSGFEPFVNAAREMFDSGSMIPGAASMKVDPLRVQFAEGNIGMYGNASQEVGVLTDQFPTKMEWGVAEIPSLDGEVKGALSALPQNGWAMTTTADNPDAAWKVIEYLSSTEVMKGYMENGYALLTSNAIAEEVDTSKIGKLAEFGTLPYESLYPQFPQVVPQGKTWEDALWEACLPGGPEVKATLDKLTKDYNDALDREVEMGKVKRLVIKDFDPLNPSAGTYEYLSK